MMNKEQILEIFQKTGALLEGHFLLTSGRHSKQYMQCAKVFQYPEYAQELAQKLIKAFKDDEVDMVIGPAVGGIILAYEVSRGLGVKNIFAEREEGVMALRRGFEIPSGAKVLVVEDVITTGGSVKEVVDLVAKEGGKTIGAGILVDRSNQAIDFGVKLHSLLKLDVQSYPAEECPLCQEDIQLTRPGSRNI